MKWIVDIILEHVQGVHLRIPIEDAQTADQARMSAEFQIAQRLPLYRPIVVGTTPTKSNSYPDGFDFEQSS